MNMRRSMLGCLIGFCVVSWVAAKEVPHAVIPVAVSNAIAHLLPGAVIEKVEIETEGIKVFELGVKRGDREVDVTVTPEGMVLEVEKKAALDRIPPVVQAALEKVAQGKDIKEVNRETVYCDVVVKHHKTPKIAYEADVQRDGHTVTIKLDPEGKILTREVEEHHERGQRVQEHGSRGDREEHEADEIKGHHRNRDEQADEKGQAEHRDWQEHSAGKMEDHDRGDHEDGQVEEAGEHHHPGDEEAEDHGRTEKDDHDEILLDIHEIPRAVRATINKHRQDGKVTEIELKIDHGRIVYAVEITQGRHETDLLISPKGRFLGREDDAAEHGNDKGRMTNEKENEDD